jgi:hypothetical protein
VQLKEVVWKEWKQKALTQMEFLWGPTGGAKRQKWRRKVRENGGTLGRDSLQNMKRSYTFHDGGGDGDDYHYYQHHHRIR